MPPSKTSRKPAQSPSAKEKHYDLLFPNPKGVPSIWFDQFSIEETSTHLIVKIGSTIGDHVFSFALSKSEMAKQNLNFGDYVEKLAPFTNGNEVNSAKIKRLPTVQTGLQPIHSVRYIRAGRVDQDGELVLYTFSSTTMLHGDQLDKTETKPVFEAETVAVLHASLSVHYSLVLELLPFTKEGLS